MAKFVSYVVEDEPDQAAFTRDILAGHGFDVHLHSSAAPALADIKNSDEIVDLIVLDRRLPLTDGAAPSNGVGDDLLTSITELCPDALVVVFTGYADVEHVQFAKRSRGTIELQSGSVSIDKVEHFQKSESIEFESYIGGVETVLRTIDQVELTGLEGATPRTKRLLRRVCHEYGGRTIDVRELSGGLTGAGVWRCFIRDAESVVADLVVKRTKKPLKVGGLQSILPASLVAGTVASIRGLCGGARAIVLQVAGKDAHSLLDLLETSPSSAGDVSRSLQTLLDSLMSSHRKVETLENIVAPFAEWSTIETVLTREGIPVPDGSAYATTSWIPQHGDLHPANVLIVGDAPLLIDFDSEVTGSALVDAVAMCLGAIFHMASPLRSSEWPEAAHGYAFLSDDFLLDCPAPEYFQACQQWIQERASSDREKWSLILAFAARNMNYPDVRDHARLNAYARALCDVASDRISSS